MAMAMKCDICGEYYDYYKTIPNKEIYFNTVDLGIRKQTDRTTLEAHNRLDCCPDCANSIKEMVDGLWERGKIKMVKKGETNEY